MATNEISVNQDNTLKNMPLFFYFWLPASKDAFGFSTWESAPLNSTYNLKFSDPRDRRPRVELPISRRFQEQFMLKSHYDELGPIVLTGDLSPGDGELALRVVRSAFQYTPIENRGVEYLNRPLHGELSVFSNGLYLWRFDIKFDSHIHTPESMEKTLREFLKIEFFNAHLTPLFELDWSKPFQGQIIEKEEETLSGYTGALNYYQAELLYNSLFNINIQPAMFFNTQKDDDNPPIPPKKYSLKNIFNSIAMFGWNRNYDPLTPGRKNYALRGEYDEDNRAHIETERMYGNPTQAPAYEEREILFSRLTYSAMEHFARVSISFGLALYKEGLEFCGKRILKDGFISRINKATGQIYPTWLSINESISTSFTLLSSYHSLIQNKITSFRFLHELMKDLRDISKPLSIDMYDTWRVKLVGDGSNSTQCDNDDDETSIGSVVEPESRYESSEWEAIDDTINNNNDITHADPESTEKLGFNKPGLIEWRFSEKTLNEALNQLSRQILVITSDVELTGNQLQAERENQAQGEFTELRKLNEIIAEQSQNTLKIDPAYWNRLTWLLAIGTIFLTVISSYVQLGMWLIDARFTDGHIIEQVFDAAGNSSLAWTILSLVFFISLGMVMLVCVVAIIWISRVRDTKSSEEVELSNQIFEYPALHEPLTRTQLNEAVRKWRSNLPEMTMNLQEDIQAPLSTQHLVKCVKFERYTELPTVGVEKDKFSFTSEFRSDSYYLIHFEIEHHRFSDSLYLTDVRLVIKHKVEHDKDYREEAQHLLAFIITALLDRSDKSTYEILFNNNFGYGYPFTAQAT